MKILKSIKKIFFSRYCIGNLVFFDLKSMEVDMKNSIEGRRLNFIQK